MLGALGQIVMHDIIPTFFAESKTTDPAGMSMEGMSDSGSDAYIEKHSEAEFSHGICPECARKLYPEYFSEKLPSEE